MRGSDRKFYVVLVRIQSILIPAGLKRILVLEGD
jgi:hypothetical protein